jgi:hypothetical protein
LKTYIREKNEDNVIDNNSDIGDDDNDNFHNKIRGG